MHVILMFYVIQLENVIKMKISSYFNVSKNKPLSILNEKIKIFKYKFIFKAFLLV